MLISDQIKSEHGKGISHRSLAVIYREKNHLDKSKKEFEISEETLKNVDEKGEIAELYYNYALLWKKMGKKKRYKKYLQDALTIFKDLGMNRWINKCDKELTK